MESKKQTFQELIQSEKPVLVDFYADWCGPCKMMAPVVEQFSTEMGEKVRVIKVDIDRNPSAAAAYQIQGVPTFILFKKGSIVWQQAGAVSGLTLKKVVEQHIVNG